ncbi:DUF3160 domain-containing protein [bacterium]|nr:DUF3160 domain-containing protein [bacterium]
MRKHLRRPARAAAAVLVSCALVVSLAVSACAEGAEAAADLGLSDWGNRALADRGFVVVPSDVTGIPEAYSAIRDHRVHTFITADTVLRTTRLFLDEVLYSLEDGELYDRLTQLSREMVRLSGDQYLLTRDPVIREAARLNLAYFSVGLSLLDPAFFPSEAGLALVERELDLIEEGRVVGFSPIMGAVPLDGVAGPGEDYSHYIPTGHYATSEQHARFFRAVTWYSRMAFALPEGRVEDNRLTIQALLIVRALEEEAGEWLELWERVHEPILFFNGGAGDPTVADYMAIADEVFGEEFDLDVLTDLEAVTVFAERVRETAPTHFETHELRGMRLLPARRFHDVRYFRRLGIGSESGPSASMSLMALLGSDAARRVLEREDAFARDIYRRGFQEIELELEEMTYGDWTNDLYWSWLHVIAALFEPTTETRPPYMQTDAWDMRMLSTAAAAWADLRRAPANVAEPTRALRAALPTAQEGACAMVEPYPELYVRIEDLIGHVRGELWEYDLLDAELRERLDAYAGFVGSFERSCFGVFGAGVLAQISVEQGTERRGGRDSRSSGAGLDRQAFITTAYSDLSTRIAIDVGLGHPDIIYVRTLRDGESTLFGGAISSFYEFEREETELRTHEEWLDGLARGTAKQPDWALSFLVEQ